MRVVAGPAFTKQESSRLGSDDEALSKEVLSCMQDVVNSVVGDVQKSHGAFTSHYHPNYCLRDVY